MYEFTRCHVSMFVSDVGRGDTFSLKQTWVYFVLCICGLIWIDYHKYYLRRDSCQQNGLIVNCFLKHLCYISVASMFWQNRFQKGSPIGETGLLSPPVQNVWNSKIPLKKTFQITTRLLLSSPLVFIQVAWPCVLEVITTKEAVTQNNMVSVLLTVAHE